MSQEGWQRFLRAEDLGDWVVLHGGAAALFRVGSIGEAGRLASVVAQVRGLDTGQPVITIAGNYVSVRLAPGVFKLEDHHAELARAVSRAARELGAVADRSAVHEVQLAIASKPDELDADFWRAALGYDALDPDNAIDPLGRSSAFWVQELDPARPLRHAMHVDVSVPREEVEGRVAAALAAGGRVADDSRAPGSTILADRAGNKVCICAWPDGAHWPDPTT